MDLIEQLDAHGCTFMTVGAVIYNGLVCGSHFGDKSVKYNSDVRHFQVYWYICLKLVWCATNEYISLPGFQREEAESNTEAIMGFLGDCEGVPGAMDMDEIQSKVFPELREKEKDEEVATPEGGGELDETDSELND